MPHACTNCGRTFPDGSKEMLSGCPDCGGNKFRYHPGSVSESAADEASGEASGDASPRSPPDPDDEGLPGRDRGVVDRATTTVRDWVSQRSDPPGGPTPDPTPGRDDTDTDSGTDESTPSPPASGAATSSSQSTAASQSSSPSSSSPSGSTGDGTTDSPAGSESESGSESVQASMADTENTAQADARTGVARPDEITEGAPEDGTAPTSDGPTVGPDAPAGSAADTAEGGAPDLSTAQEKSAPADADGDSARAAAQPSESSATGAAEEPADPAATPSASNLAQLREELNEQFESIKIVEPGEYELNLMGLYDREEYIISLMEDGRYAIEVPETWRDAEDLSD